MIDLLKCKGKAATKKARGNFAFQGRKEAITKGKINTGRPNILKKTKRQLNEDSYTFFRVLSFKTRVIIITD